MRVEDGKDGEMCIGDIYSIYTYFSPPHTFIQNFPPPWPLAYARRARYYNTRVTPPRAAPPPTLPKNFFNFPPKTLDKSPVMWYNVHVINFKKSHQATQGPVAGRSRRETSSLRPLTISPSSQARRRPLPSLCATGIE